MANARLLGDRGTMNDTNIMEPQIVQEKRSELTAVSDSPTTDWTKLDWFGVWLSLARPANSDADLGASAT
jgi:hypothetical protein